MSFGCKVISLELWLDEFRHEISFFTTWKSFLSNNFLSASNVKLRLSLGESVCQFNFGWQKNTSSSVIVMIKVVISDQNKLKTASILVF